jgi:hypothetical protein
MKARSDTDEVRELLAAVLTFLAEGPEKQAEQISTFYDEISRRGQTYDLQHPLVELSEWLCKIPWSDDSPREVVEILEEIDGVTTLMFWEKELTMRFTSIGGLAAEPAWRVIRKLAEDALRKGGFEKADSTFPFTDLVLAIAD